MRSRARFVTLACGALALLAAVPFPSARAADNDVLGMMHHYGCVFCHAPQETIAGPSWADIAARYRSNPQAVSILTKVIRQGEHGGLWPMPPLPQVTDADARKLVRYILATKPNPPASAAIELTFAAWRR